MHTGEKPFGCPVEGCMMRFKQKSQQYSHMRNKHHIDTNLLPKSKKGYVLPESIQSSDPTFQASTPGPYSGIPGSLGSTLSSSPFMGQPQNFSVPPIFQQPVALPSMMAQSGPQVNYHTQFITQADITAQLKPQIKSEIDDLQQNNKKQ